MSPGEPWRLPRLESRRLVLRPLTAQDEVSVFGYASDPEVSRYTLWNPHRNPEDTRSFLRQVEENYRQQVPDPFALELRSEPGKVIGTAGCYWASEPHRTMELGYALGRPYWGQGLAAEAAWVVICFAFAIYPVQRLQARVVSGHLQSTRVLDKVGMSHEGRLRSALLLGDEPRDVEMFSLLRPEWQKRVAASHPVTPLSPADPTAKP